MGNWGTWKILKEMGLDMGFWGSDPAQVGDLLEPELMGIRVLPGDPYLNGNLTKSLKKLLFRRLLGWRGEFAGNFGNWPGRFGGFRP